MSKSTKKKVASKRKPPFDCIVNADCIEGMKSLPENSVDLVITDPPFGIDFKADRANYNRKSSRVLEGYNEVKPKDYLSFSVGWMAEAHRLLKDTGSCFIFSGWNYLKDILIAADEVGFTTVNHIIWKYQFGVATKRKFVSSHYHLLFLCKDDKKRKFYLDSRYSAGSIKGLGSPRYRDMEDVWVINREYWTGEIKTPTKLPFELVDKILSYASQEGDVVLDPFLGSGQVAVISKLSGRHYIGFEVVPEYYSFIEDRLKNEKVYRDKAKQEEPKTGYPLFVGVAK